MATLRSRAIALALAMTLAGTALADPLDAATAAFNRGDYAGAARLLQPLAEAGNHAAQYNLALMYRDGQGIPRDSAAAQKWFTKSAEQGDADAQNDLAAMYQEGNGVPQNLPEAVKWYRQAAEHGNAGAQFNLGYMYGRGEGTPPNFIESYRWFALAAQAMAATDSPNRDKAERNRDVLAERLTPEQLATAMKLVREWKPAP